MLFNSLHFVFFFPVVAGVYFLLPSRYRGFLLLGASYYFYMCWEPRYILLIVTSTLIDYFAAQQISRTERQKIRKLCLLLSLVANFGLLFAFKYFNFFSKSFAAAFSSFGFDVSATTLDVLLPVGISFYTFQTVSYTIDVYRGVQKPERNLAAFALYVSFFPQLVAGPIERASHLLPQFHEKYAFDYDRVRSGLLLMLWGFFKKLVIADRLAFYVTAVYDEPAAYGGLPFVLAIYFFTFQLYADFSGYADIAIGSAQVMGYDLRENFRRPYFSKSIAEFWRRWHISLSSWMRDYLYIPLGGNRVSKSRNLVNLFVVFLLAGLWHGANWTYVVWGGLHGAYLVVGAMTKEWRDAVASRFLPGRLMWVRTLWQVIVTFHLFAFSLVIFRARSLTDACLLVVSTVSDFKLKHPLLFEPLPVSEIVVGCAAIGILFVAQLLQRKGPVRERVAILPLPIRWTLYLALLFGTITFGMFTSEEFIYFQF
jgi:D-alanyl-lipoteichoic acid acyltransferase DltB (MBOAT superfamily)